MSRAVFGYLPFMTEKHVFVVPKMYVIAIKLLYCSSNHIMGFHLTKTFLPVVGSYL